MKFLQLLFLTILSAIIVSHTFLKCQENRPEKPLKKEDILFASLGSPKDKENVTFIDEDCNAFAGSLSAMDIHSLAKNDCIKYIVRLNGNTPNDKGFMTIEEEAALCEGYGIRFYYFNIENQIEKMGATLSDLMSKGGVVVHCRNGKHRAPSMAAFFLRSRGVKRGEIIQLIGWQELVREPGDYSRYVLPSLK